MAGYIGSKSSVTQVDGYNKTEADAEFVQVAGDTMTGDLTVTKAGTPIIADRTGSDGTILDLKKDGTTVGSIGTLFGDLYVATGNTGIRCVDANRSISAYDSNAGGLVDAAVDLGFDTTRFKDLYLSGGVYLGGTGAANKLDDYEFGDFTPSIRGTQSAGTASYAQRHGRYVRIGNLVHVNFYIEGTWYPSPAGSLEIIGLPFTVYNKNTYPSVKGAIGHAVSGFENSVYLYAVSNTNSLGGGVSPAGGLVACVFGTHMSITNFQTHIGLTYQTA